LSGIAASLTSLMYERITKPSKYKWSRSGCKDIQKAFSKLKKQASRVYHYANPGHAELLDFVLCPAVAMRWTDKIPLWCQIIGAPGSGKTEHVTLFEGWKDVRFVSRLSSNSLISGFRPDGNLEADPSFLNELDGKLFIVKDFTCILQSPKTEREAIIGQLRDIYDGRASRVLGNVGYMEYKARFNMLLAVTAAIDSYHSVHQQLGERFVVFRERLSDTNRLAVTETAFRRNLNNTHTVRKQKLVAQIKAFVEALPDIKMKQIKWSRDYIDKAIRLADFIARCRSHVVRAKNGWAIAGREDTEVGTRLSLQLQELMAAYCLLHGYPEVNEEALTFGTRIMRDTLPGPVAWILYWFFTVSEAHRKIEDTKTYFSVTPREVARQCRISTTVVEHTLTDFSYHGIAKAKNTGQTGPFGIRFTILPQTVDLLHACDFFQNYDVSTDVAKLMANITQKRKDRDTDKKM